jgi:hypothetical protein
MGTLVVVSESAMILRLSTLPPATDAAGEVDYGHIDAFGPRWRPVLLSGPALWTGSSPDVA